MTLVPDQTPLLIIDVQLAIDDPVWGERNNPNAESNIARLLEAWRRVSWPIIHIRHDSTDDASPYRPGQIGNTFKQDVAPQSGELVIGKTTNSAFIGTDLEQRLRQMGWSSLVVTGVITNNSVEATVRMAGNLGFATVVVADATATVGKTDLGGRFWPAEDVHALALANMHGEYATVMTTEDLLAALASLTGRDPRT